MAVPNCPFELDFASLPEPMPNICYGHYTDYAAAVLVAVSLPLVRFVLDRTIFQFLMTRVLGKGTPESKLIKAKESFWKLCAYVFLVSLAVYAVDHEWITNTWSMWEGCTSVPCTVPTLPKVKLLYVFEMAYYLQEVPMLFIWATRRKDFYQLLAHHFATLGLIVYSLELGITKSGAVIYLLHDINDPFMEVAKICRYSSRKRLHDWALVFFIAFVVSWFVSRVYYYPVVVIKSTLFECSAIARNLGVSIEPHYTILNVLLCFLLVLHVYWSYLIVRIIVRQLTTKDLNDSREDDSDEEEEDKPAASGDDKKRS